MLKNNSGVHRSRANAEKNERPLAILVETKKKKEMGKELMWMKKVPNFRKIGRTGYIINQAVIILSHTISFKISRT